MADSARHEPAELALFDFEAPQAGRNGVRAPTADLTVAVVGLGYVGLPTALAMHAAGAGVIGLEISEARISAIRSGLVDATDADLERLSNALAEPRFRITDDPTALAHADAVIVCVPTPVDEHLAPELGPLRAAAATVVAMAVPGQLIVLTSTSYVGCTRDLVARPLENRGFTIGTDAFVAYSPERIDPGNARHPQEVVPRVLGGVTPACAARAEAVIRRVAPVHRVTSPEAAELTKLYENTFRAVNIALVNEIEGISRTLDLDMAEVIDAASTKPFGFMPFRPGAGVGGHCIPCDPHYLLWQLRAHRQSAPVIEQAMADIAARPSAMVERAVAALSRAGTTIRDARVVVVGAAYKAGVADVRESPAIEILAELRARGADVRYVDPLVPTLRLPDGHVLHNSPQDVADHADLVIVHVLQSGVDAGRFLACHVVIDPGETLRRAMAGPQPHQRSVQRRRTDVVTLPTTRPDPESDTGDGDRGAFERGVRKAALPRAAAARP